MYIDRQTECVCVSGPLLPTCIYELSIHFVHKNPAARSLEETVSKEHYYLTKLFLS